MNAYSYRIFKTSLANPLYGGVVHANSMDDAVTKVLTSNNVKVVPIEFIGAYTSRIGYVFQLKKEKVSIVVWANPEDYIEEN